MNYDTNEHAGFNPFQNVFQANFGGFNVGVGGFGFGFGMFPDLFGGQNNHVPEQNRNCNKKKKKKEK